MMKLGSEESIGCKGVEFGHIDYWVGATVTLGFRSDFAEELDGGAS